MHFSYAGRLFNQVDLERLRDGFMLRRLDGKEVKDQELYNFVMKRLGKEESCLR